jgi:hypothetical protein
MGGFYINGVDLVTEQKGLLETKSKNLKIGYFNKYK